MRSTGSIVHCRNAAAMRKLISLSCKFLQMIELDTELRRPPHASLVSSLSCMELLVMGGVPPPTPQRVFLTYKLNDYHFKPQENVAVWGTAPWCYGSQSGLHV